MKDAKIGLVVLLIGGQALLAGYKEQPISAAVAQSVGESVQMDQSALPEASRNCVNPAGKGGAQTAPYANGCHIAMQFTINWLGASPGRMITYRITQNGARDVKRQDRQAIFVKEVPAKLGMGPVVVVTLRSTSYGNSHILYIKNTTPSYLFVIGEINIVRDQNVFAVCRLADTIPPLGRTRVCPYSNGDTVKIKKLVAEKDPD
jgi:hypothetical protein